MFFDNYFSILANRKLPSLFFPNPEHLGPAKESSPKTLLRHRPCSIFSPRLPGLQRTRPATIRWRKTPE